MSPAAILVVGEAIGDFVPRDTEGRVCEAVLGGSGFNAALAQEGVGTGLIRNSACPRAVAIMSPLGADGVPEFGLHQRDAATFIRATHGALA